MYNGQDFLLDHYQIALYPSSSILSLRKKSRNNLNKEIIAFGLSDTEIPEVKKEIENLKQIFGSAQVFLDEQAKITIWKDLAEKASILHVATHGIFRPDNPMFSRLSFSDGWLTARDLYGFQLPGSLVVLSACETGLTGTQRNNEHLGLVRAFFHSGAESLVTTLWSIKDQTTAKLFKLFYNKLSQSSSVSEALQHAQQELRKQYPNPYYWAAFQINGNPNWSWV